MVLCGRQLPPPCSEELDQHQSGDEAADVRHVRHAATVARLSDRSDLAEQLEDNPESEDDDRGNESSCRLA